MQVRCRWVVVGGGGMQVGRICTLMMVGGRGRGGGGGGGGKGGGKGGTGGGGG